ncbi:TIGR03364 family FAD-dependent oxidoreductase [Microbacterium sediminis]|uniref:Oxidoreductase n=1 Tax=Microbacterium sediminis TaxID=904291 RepID=A0A1B9N8C3_9MICO|nr:TIGR03364 family FAD-dependent oxidoreductase [Microbacterium sediminis]OCG72851.1 oxidoreductase [Microbacterium sediminis]QBR73471.1 TIGR03364 family FAD-dependent oxidoreductase [Microbacterium sediminis]
MSDGYDLAVVGAGIVGLGHAAAALERGLKVVVIDRATAVAGSTIRNFGHAGFSAHAGEAGEYARVAREVWQRLAARAGFWARETGTLVVARHEDELAVLRESGVGDLLSAAGVEELAPVRGAVGGALRRGDMQIDPREAGPTIAAWLREQGVEFRWRTAALGVEPGVLHTSRGEIRAEAIVVAVNFDVDHLFPDIAEEHGVVRCGLDMMLTDGVGLRIPVLTGSSMLRYSAFAAAPSIADVRARIAAQEPGILERDVNQMYTERPDGTLLVGDTHYGGETILPFQDEDAFTLLGRLGEELFGRPLRVRQRWQGIYAKAPGDFLRVAPRDGVRVVSVTTGIGMTTGLGLAESVIAELFGEAR